MSSGGTINSTIKAKVGWQGGVGHKRLLVRWSLLYYMLLALNLNYCTAVHRHWIEAKERGELSTPCLRRAIITPIPRWVFARHAFRSVSRKVGNKNWLLLPTVCCFMSTCLPQVARPWLSCNLHSSVGAILRSLEIASRLYIHSSSRNCSGTPCFGPGVPRGYSWLYCICHAVHIPIFAISCWRPSSTRGTQHSVTGSSFHAPHKHDKHDYNFFTPIHRGLTFPSPLSPATMTRSWFGACLRTGSLGLRGPFWWLGETKEPSDVAIGKFMIVSRMYSSYKGNVWDMVWRLLGGTSQGSSILVDRKMDDSVECALIA